MPVFRYSNCCCQTCSAVPFYLKCPQEVFQTLLTSAMAPLSRHNANLSSPQWSASLAANDASVRVFFLLIPSPSQDTPRLRVRTIDACDTYGIGYFVHLRLGILVRTFFLTISTRKHRLFRKYDAIVLPGGAFSPAF